MDKKCWCKNLLGVILFPLCISTTIAFSQEVIKKSWTPNIAYFFLGAATYLFIHLFFHKPIVAYITGHELTHALWGFLFGARIKKMKIGRRGGSVAMTKTNILVSLAPYVFPIYTFLVMMLYFIISFFWQKEWMAQAAVFLIGATFSFHLALSLYALRIRQPDLKAGGFLFSTVFIYLANIFVLTVIFTLISHRISLGDFLFSSVEEGKLVYNRIIDSLVSAVEAIRGYITSLRAQRAKL